MYSVKIKRIYEAPAKTDGYRILVDRLWPRGITKAAAHLDEWNKDIAPSPPLRKWFNHDPGKFDAFTKKYLQELEKHHEALQRLRMLAQEKPLCLLYAARDEACNHARVLAETILNTPPSKPARKNQEPELSSPVCYANSDEVREEFREEFSDPGQKGKKTNQ